MHPKTLRILSVLLAIAALAGGYSASRLLQQPEPVQVPPLGGEFTLQSSAGPVSLSDFRGKVVLIYFGYTFCPDACPTSLAYLGMAMKRLTDDERQQIQPLFISVDPERDTPERLAEYVKHFGGGMLGLTGTVEEVTAVAAQYGVYFKTQKAGDDDEFYLVDHTSRTYVMDREGDLIVPLQHGTTAETVAQALRDALQ